MATGKLSNLVRHLRRAGLLQDGAGLTDGELLSYFLARRDEAAFEALVRRHGPMVLGVCRRVLRNAHDADDAFQATFLVLVRKARAVQGRETLGNWLYGVAYRTALKARAAEAKRRLKEAHVKELPQPESRTENACQDWQSLLDQELSRLPDKYRQAVVLCHLQGKTRVEAAQQLGIPVGTLSGRLTTARRILARRLTRRGLALSSGLLAGLCPNGTSACVPVTLVVSTVRGAMLLATGPVTTGAISAQVALLTEGVVKATLITQVKMLTAVVLAVSVAGVGGSILTLQMVRTWDKASNGTPKVSETASGREIRTLRSDEERLQGTWFAVSGEEHGQELSRPMLQAWGQLNFTEGQVRRQGRERREGTYKVAPDKQPKEIDLFTEVNTWRGIYRLDGTTLTLVLRFGERRPTDFDSRDAVLLIFAQQRHTDPGAGSQ